MIPAVIISAIQQMLSRVLRIPVQSVQLFPVGGGSINQTHRLLVNNNLEYFCKTNSATKFPLLLQKEKNGLKLLAAQNIIRVPEIIACEVVEDTQILILEWITQGLRTEGFWKNFGEQLAGLHHVTGQSFGLYEDNYMGALPQSNLQSGDWVTFFINQRLKPLARLAMNSHLLEPKHIRHFENLYKELPGFFTPAQPSLLHGDLWGGNFLAGSDHLPVLIDPAVYFGDRGMDLAMTTLFGGFEPGFYESYDYHFPLPENHRQQWDICNLYPLLVHLNLFGKSYLHDIIHTIQRY